MRTLLLFLGLAGATPVAAQNAPPTPASAPPSAARVDTASTTPPDTAALVIGSDTVIVFRGAVGSLSAHDRAELAGDRVRRARIPGQDSVELRTDPDGIMVVLNKAPVFSVRPGDLPPAALVDHEAFARAVSGRLVTALAEDEAEHSVRAVVFGVVQAVLATILLVLLVRALAWGRQWLIRQSTRRPHHLEVSGVELVSDDAIRRTLYLLLGALSWVVGLLLAYAWITFCLTRFADTRPWGMIFGGFLVTTAEAIGAAMLNGIPGLITVALIILATRGVLALLRTFFDAIERQGTTILGIHPETVPATRRIVTAAAWLFALAMAYPFLPGSSSDAFRGVSVLAGVLVTFGSAGLVGQAMSGLLLMYTRGFRVGDFIRVGTTEGTVVELGMLSTRIRTVANEFVLVPNNTVVSGSIVDYSSAHREGQVHHVTSSVTIGYDTPWRRIHELLIAAGGKLGAAHATARPFVLQRSLGDFYVAYEVFVPIQVEHAGAIPRLRSELNGLIQDTFWAAGQEITSPHFYALRDGNAITIPPESNPPPSGRAFAVSVGPK